MLALWYRTVDHRLYIIDLLQMNNWCLCIFTYLWMVIGMVFVSCEATDQSERRMTDHGIWNYRVKLVSKTV